MAAPPTGSQIPESTASTAMSPASKASGNTRATRRNSGGATGQNANMPAGHVPPPPLLVNQPASSTRTTRNLRPRSNNNNSDSNGIINSSNPAASGNGRAGAVANSRDVSSSSGAGSPDALQPLRPMRSSGGVETSPRNDEEGENESSESSSDSSHSPGSEAPVVVVNSSAAIQPFGGLPEDSMSSLGSSVDEDEFFGGLDDAEASAGEQAPRFRPMGTGIEGSGYGSVSPSADNRGTVSALPPFSTSSSSLGTTSDTYNNGGWTRPGELPEAELDALRCRLCGSAEDEDVLLLCDGAPEFNNGDVELAKRTSDRCYSAVHLYCLPKRHMPLGGQLPAEDAPWFCPPCVAHQQALDASVEPTDEALASPPPSSSSSGAMASVDPTPQVPSKRKAESPPARNDEPAQKRARGRPRKNTVPSSPPPPAAEVTATAPLEHSREEPNDRSRVELDDRSPVDRSRVESDDHSPVELDNQSIVEPDDHSPVDFDNQSRVELDDHSTVEPDNHSRVVPDNPSRVEPDNLSPVEPDSHNHSRVEHDRLSRVVPDSHSRVVPDNPRVEPDHDSRFEHDQHSRVEHDHHSRVVPDRHSRFVPESHSRGEPDNPRVEPDHDSRFEHDRHSRVVPDSHSRVVPESHSRGEPDNPRVEPDNDSRVELDNDSRVEPDSRSSKRDKEQRKGAKSPRSHAKLLKRKAREAEKQADRERKKRKRDKKGRSLETNADAVQENLRGKDDRPPAPEKRRPGRPKKALTSSSNSAEPTRPVVASKRNELGAQMEPARAHPPFDRLVNNEGTTAHQVEAERRQQFQDRPRPHLQQQQMRNFDQTAPARHARADASVALPVDSHSRPNVPSRTGSTKHAPQPPRSESPSFEQAPTSFEAVDMGFTHSASSGFPPSPLASYRPYQAPREPAASERQRTHNIAEARGHRRSERHSWGDSSEAFDTRQSDLSSFSGNDRADFAIATQALGGGYREERRSWGNSFGAFDKRRGDHNTFPEQERADYTNSNRTFGGVSGHHLPDNSFRAPPQQDVDVVGLHQVLRERARQEILRSWTGPPLTETLLQSLVAKFVDDAMKHALSSSR